MVRSRVDTYSVPACCEWQVRLGEKEALESVLRFFEQREALLPTLEYYQERRLKRLGLLDDSKFGPRNLGIAVEVEQVEIERLNLQAVHGLSGVGSGLAGAYCIGDTGTCHCSSMLKEQ